jgi:hypothetical protein
MRFNSNIETRDMLKTSFTMIKRNSIKLLLNDKLYKSKGDFETQEMMITK